MQLSLQFGAFDVLQYASIDLLLKKQQDLLVS